MKAKKRKNRKSEIRTNCNNFINELENFKEMRCSKGNNATVIYHVMFNDEIDRKRLLNYWPSNGKVYDQINEVKKIVKDCYEAFNMAVEIKNKKYGYIKETFPN